MKTVPHEVPARGARTTILVPLLWLCAGVALGILIRSWWEREEAPPVPAPPMEQAEQGERGEGTRAEIAAVNAPVKGRPLDRLRALAEGGGPVDSVEVGLIIRELQAGECGEALKLIRRIPAEERRALLEVLARHWSRTDPASAFSAAVSERRDNDWRNRLGYPAGAALAAIDPAGALEQITRARNNDLRVKTAEWVLPALAKTDPHRAAGYLLTNRFLQRHEHIFRNVATEFARVRPHEAIAWAGRAAAQSNVQDKKRFRESLLVNVWSAWAGADPVACAAAISANPEAKHHENVYGSLAQAWSRKDLFAALNWAEALPDAQAKSAALRSMEVDLQSVGPEQAREFIGAVSSEGMRAEYATRIAQQMAQEDVSSALAWVESLPEGAARSKALEPVFNEWAMSDPAAASQRIVAMPESKERSELLARAVNVWTEGDPQAAFTFIQQLPAGKSRDQAVAVAIHSIHEDHPQKAVEWYRTMEDPEAKAGVAVRLMGGLIRTDRATALELAAELPPEAQPDAYKGLVRQWAFDQTKEAGEWINGLPAGKARDAAVESYVSVIDGMDPALATKWAQSIDDPVNRMESTFKSFHRWIEKDRAGAVQWVEQAEIPEGLRPIYERLLKDKDYFD